MTTDAPIHYIDARLVAIFSNFTVIYTLPTFGRGEARCSRYFKDDIVLRTLKGLPFISLLYHMVDRSFDEGH